MLTAVRLDGNLAVVVHGCGDRPIEIAAQDIRAFGPVAIHYLRGREMKSIPISERYHGNARADGVDECK